MTRAGIKLLIDRCNSADLPDVAEWIECTAAKLDDYQKMVKVLKAAVDLVCSPSWSGVSDEDCELERVLRECGYVRAGKTEETK